MYYIQNNDLARWDRDTREFDSSFPVPWLTKEYAYRLALQIASDHGTELAIVHVDANYNETLVDRVDFSPEAGA